jgi:transposase
VILLRMTQDRISSAAGKSAATAGAKRKFRSRLERRKVAEEALKPGAAVAEIARAHGVRPNQVRHWRSLYCQGLLDEAASSALVPVTITDTAGKVPAISALKTSATEGLPGSPVPPPGTIRIETEKARLYVEGAAEASCLRVVLEYLLG